MPGIHSYCRVFSPQTLTPSILGLWVVAVQGGSECPALPFGLCPRLWNEEHAPDHEEDDVAIYGERGRMGLVAGVASMLKSTLPWLASPYS